MVFHHASQLDKALVRLRIGIEDSLRDLFGLFNDLGGRQHPHARDIGVKPGGGSGVTALASILEIAPLRSMGVEHFSKGTTGVTAGTGNEERRARAFFRSRQARARSASVLAFLGFLG